jgi:hypothetical protein
VLFATPLSILLFAGLAGAADVATVDGPSFQRRADALAVAHVARAEGLKPRVARAYEHGEGWRWRVVLRGFTAIDDATGAASRASLATGRYYVVRSADPLLRSPSIVERAEPAPLDPYELLLRARRAHGPVDSLERLESADAVTFRFVRVLPDGRRIAHVYVRDGARTFLSFEPEGGLGDARATYLLADGRAWAATGGEPLVERDFFRTRDLVQRFAPHRVLQPALALPSAIADRRGLRPLETDGPDPAPFAVDGGVDGARAALWIDPATARVVRIVHRTSGEGLVRTFSIEPVGPFAVPSVTSTWRDGAEIDRVEVVDLRLERSAEAALPSLHGGGPT